jgi:hypothetical protein
MFLSANPMLIQSAAKVNPGANKNTDINIAGTNFVNKLLILNPFYGFIMD